MCEGPADGRHTGRRRVPGVAIALGSLAATALTGCGITKAEEPPDATAPVSTPPPTPAHEKATILIREQDGTPTQVGEADVKVSVRTLDGGRVGTAKGPDRQSALSFPGYIAAGSYPRAVVLVSNVDDDDVLNPAERPFTWGADFRVNSRSTGRSEDNGDNLIQRGLYSQDSEYKAEVDLDRPACVVHGDEGIVTVRGDAIVPGTWYHVECRRRGYRVTVTTWALDNPRSKFRRSGFGPTGDVTPYLPTIPLTIGGKVAPDGSIIRSDTDQFNGDVAEAFLRIGGPDPD